MNFLQGLGIMAVLAWLSLTIAIMYGWVMNIVTLIQGGYQATIELVIAIIGIFVAPVGALMYYIVR